MRPVSQLQPCVSSRSRQTMPLCSVFRHWAIHRTSLHPHITLSTANKFLVTCLSLLFLRTVQYNLQTHWCLTPIISTAHKWKDYCSLLFPLLLPRISSSHLFLSGVPLRNLWFWPWKEDQSLYLNKQTKNCWTPIWPLHSFYWPQSQRHVSMSTLEPGETPRPHERDNMTTALFWAHLRYILNVLRPLDSNTSCDKSLSKRPLVFSPIYSFITSYIPCSSLYSLKATFDIWQQCNGSYSRVCTDIQGRSWLLLI